MNDEKLKYFELAISFFNSLLDADKGKIINENKYDKFEKYLDAIDKLSNDIKKRLK